MGVHNTMDMGSGGASATGVEGTGMSAAAATAGMMAFQVWQGYQQADAVRRQNQLNQKIGEMNAQLIEEDAWNTEVFGRTQIARYQAEVDAVEGAQKVAMAMADVDTTEGTGAELMAETQLTAKLNNLDILNQARAKALGLRTQASNVRLGMGMQNAQAEVAASSAQAAGYINAAATGVSAYTRK